MHNRIIKKLPFIYLGLGVIAVVVSLFHSATVESDYLAAPVRADAVGYFAYLPAVIVEQDLSFNFMIKPKAADTGGKNTFKAKYNPEQAKTLGFNVDENTGKYFNKYPVGVAVLLTPFYLLSHFLNILFDLKNGGFGPIYQYAAFAGGIVYGLAGLYFLQLTLSNRFKFTPKVVVSTLLVILFGTNLLSYATFENIYSHVYSFFLVSVLCYFTTKLNIKKLTWKSLLPVGLSLAMLFIVRQYNLMFALIPSFYLASQLPGISLKAWFTKRNIIVLASCIALSSLVLIPQLAYWHYASGNWVAYSYTGEGFSLDNPKFFESLFSVTRGLFFWSPLLILGFWGALRLAGENRPWKWSFLTIFALTWLIVSTWSSWTFGWGHGHRIFVDMLPLFAIGLAQFFSWLATKNIKIQKFTALVVGLLVFLSFFQTLQYWQRIIPPDIKSWEDYKHIFLSLDVELIEYWKSSPEY